MLVPRELLLFLTVTFFLDLVFQILLHTSKATGCLCAATDSSNLMIAFSHHCDRTFFIDTGQK